MDINGPYIKLKEVNFNLFENYIILKNEEGNLFLNLKKKFDDENLLDRELKKINKLENLNNDFIIPLIYYNNFKKEGLCFNNYIVNCLFDFNNTFTLNKYMRHIKYLSMLDIKNIFITLLNTLNYLQTNSIYHGNIKKEMIFINEKENQYTPDFKILLNYYSYNHYENLKNCIYYSQEIYASPQLFKQFFLKEKEFNLSKFKEDSFQFGILMIKLFDKDTKKLYDFKNKKFNYEILKNYLKNIKIDLISAENNWNQYFMYIYDLIKLSLKKNPLKRYDFIGLNGLLKEKLMVKNYNSNNKTIKMNFTEKELSQFSHDEMKFVSNPKKENIISIKNIEPRKKYLSNIKITIKNRFQNKNKEY